MACGRGQRDVRPRLSLPLDGARGSVARNAVWVGGSGCACAVSSSVREDGADQGIVSLAPEGWDESGRFRLAAGRSAAQVLRLSVCGESGP